MENKAQLRLSNKFIEVLESFPEQGMGYQIVNIELKDGRVLTDRIVFNSTYLKLDKEDNFTLDEIKDIVIRR
jgi:hypothetical protein